MRWTTLTLIFSLSLGIAQDWPQWRGPNRDGTITGWKAPAQWPEKLTQRWKVSVGEGHSSPVVSGGRVFQFGRVGEDEVVFSLDAATGKVLWRQSYAAPYTMNSAATSHGKGPKSTPAVANGRLYTLGISGILSCFDAASGKLEWRKEFSKRFKTTSPLYGVATSPLVDGGVLYAHVGGHDDGALIAFDAVTGAEKWNWRGDGPGYASPIMVTAGGARQIVSETQNKVVGLAADGGKLLWEIPLTTPYDQNSVSPMLAGDLVIVGGLSNPAMALRLVNKEGKWSAQKVWENSDAEVYMNSPVASKGLLFGFAKRDRGRFYCLDLASGKMRWQGTPRAGDYASIAAAGDTLLLLTTDAELTVAKATPERFEVVKKYTVADSPTWAHVVPAPNGVLVKDSTTLALLTP